MSAIEKKAKELSKKPLTKRIGTGRTGLQRQKSGDGCNRGLRKTERLKCSADDTALRARGKGGREGGWRTLKIAGGQNRNGSESLRERASS